MKRELLRQMNAMDTLLRENFFTASMSALLPGVIAFVATGTMIRKAFRKLSGSRRRSRRSLIKQVRAVMRDAERLLIRHLAAQPEALARLRGSQQMQMNNNNPSQQQQQAFGYGGPASPPRAATQHSFDSLNNASVHHGGTLRTSRQLSEIDTGLLVISLHVLRQTVERHKVLLSAGERASFFEDLEDLESEQYDCEGKMLVLQRIYRTQPALLAGGGAASAGGAHADLGPVLLATR